MLLLGLLPALTVVLLPLLLLRLLLLLVPALLHPLILPPQELLLAILLFLPLLLPPQPPHRQEIQRRQIIMPILPQIPHQLPPLLNPIHLTNLLNLILRQFLLSDHLLQFENVGGKELV